jgi:hypothetical protein
MNVTVVNCHRRRFVGWMLSLGQNVAWSVCGWTDRQGTMTHSSCCMTVISCQVGPGF